MSHLHGSGGTQGNGGRDDAPPSDATATDGTASDDGATASDDEARFACALDDVRRHAAGEVEGAFGPGSQAWRIYREAALLLGGFRALLLQLAHPSVAAAVAAHSSFRVDPIGRAQRTFEKMYRMTFADLPTALEAARQVHARHRVVRGEQYRANDPELLLWVQATLIDTAIEVFERVVGPLSDEEQRLFHRDNQLNGALYGVPIANAPATFADFRRGFAAQLDALEVGDTARELARALFEETPGLRIARPTARRLTAGLLPESLREGFGLRFRGDEAAAFERIIERSRKTVKALPGALRFLPAYHQATVRVARARGESVRLDSRIVERLAHAVRLPFSL